MAEFDLNDPRLTAFTLGELPEHERLEIERWLEESAEARAALVEIQETIDLVKDELAAEPVPALTSSQRQVIEAQLSSSQSVSAAQPVTLAIDGASDRGSLSWRWLSLGLTAAALVGIALVLPRGTQRDELRPMVASTQEDDFSSQVAMAEPQSTVPEARLSDEASGAIAPIDALALRDNVTAFNAPDPNATSSDKRLAQRRMSGMPTEESKLQLPHNVAVKAEGISKESLRQQVAQSETRDRNREMQRKSDPLSDAPESGRSLTSRSATPSPPAGPASAKAALGAGGGAGGLPSAPNSELSKGKQVASSPAAADPAEVISAGKAVDGNRGGRPLAESESARSKTNAQKPTITALTASAPTAAAPMDAKDSSRKSGDAAPATKAAAPRVQVLFAEEAGGKKPGTVLKRPDGPRTEAEVAKLMRERAEKGSVANLEKSDAKPAVEDRTLALRSDVEKKLGEKSAESRFHYESLKESREQAPNAEAYEAITENEFLVPQESPLSTFSIDVDSASYANMRRFLTQGQLPPPNAIRIEELVNYFSYQYAQPADGQPFSVLADAAPCPWSKDNYIARIGLKARDIDKAKRPPTNLVFLIDVSGSMGTPNKLPLVKRGMSLLVEEMTETDRISIVTYAGDAGLKLEPTTGNEQARIMGVIDGLNAGGSTNGAAGINLAYEQALRHFNKEAANRVILCTDGDFNVGVSNDGELVKLIEAQAKTGVYLSIFGFGMGNLKDSKLEKLADKGNGHYGYIDDLNEARKVFNEELVGTLYTVAKDVKLQVEFNPLTVGAYRLIGYENRTLAAQDFNDDTKDAGEIGAGHTVTALYEIVPVGKWPKPSNVDPLKYAAAEKDADRKLAVAKEAAKKVPADVADDLFTVKLRYKQPDAETSVKTIDYVVDDIAGKKVVPNGDLMWAASVANFGMQLRHSKYAGQWKLEDIAETASGLVGEDRTGRRSEFVDLVKKASALRTR